jgi:RHS repeat-associated protein
MVDNGGYGGGGGGGGGGSQGAGGGGAAGGGGGGPGGSGPGAGGGTAGGGIKSAIGAGAARVADQVKTKLEIKDTGNAKVDAMGDIFNAKLALFTDAPPPEQGALGWVNKGVQVAMAVKDFTAIGQELMDTGFAMATAGIAAMMPALPAAFLTVPHLGTPHAHAHPPSLIPPAPPVPLPSIGTLMLAGSVGVLIMGMPAGRCGDLGLAMTCGSLSPAFDVFLGSSNTFIAGNRAARMGDMTRHCNPASAALAIGRGAALFSAAVGLAGVAADAVGGGPVMGAIAQIAADLAAAAMSALLGKDPGIPPAFGALMLGAPTVLIGGFPCPNLPNPLDALMHGLKCLGKAIGKSKGVGKLLKKVGLCNDPSEPISTFTGEVYNDFDDYRDDTSDFVWGRHYRSGWNEQDGLLGFGFRHFYQRSLTLHRKRAIYQTHDNEIVALAKRDDGTYEPDSGYLLRASSDGIHFELTTDRDEVLEFELALDPNVVARSARLTRYRTTRIDIGVFYDKTGRLRALSEVSSGRAVDTHFVHDAQGYIEQVHRGVRGQQPQLIARYAYANGCLVEWHDPMGAVARFRYDSARRMVQGMDRRGYSFHWHYDPHNGRCIKSYGDDGLWGVEAKYEGSISTFTEPDGAVWTFKHYPDGTLSHVVDPLGGVKQYVKNDLGRIAKQITPGGAEFVWLYDTNGKHIGRRHPLGHFVPPEDEDPNPTPLAYQERASPREYLCGRPLDQVTDALRTLPSAIAAAMQSVEAQAGVRRPPQSLPRRDAAGRVIAEVLADGGVRSLAYDPGGNIIAEHLAPPSTGPQAQYGSRGGWTTREFGSWNLLLSETTPAGNTTRYEYTHREHWRTVTDANGNSTRYVRDKRHRLQEVHRYGGIYRRYAYGPLSDAVVEEQDGDGKPLVKYATNELGLHTEAALTSGERYHYAYDSNGEFTDASSSLHRVIQRHRGSRPARDERDGKGIRHFYTVQGKVRRTRYFERFNVKYGEHAQQWRVATPDGSTHTFWRNDDRLVRELGNGSAEALRFDVEGRVAARGRWKLFDPEQGLTWSVAYRYNSSADLLFEIENDQRVTAYHFDEDHRLVARQNAEGICNWQYDPAGNLTLTPHHRVIHYVDGNVIEHADFDHFEHDVRRRIAKRKKPNGAITEYVYDSLDQLIEARFSDRIEVWRAAYDGLGRRLWRQLGEKRTDFYWDEDRLAAERFPDGRLRLYIYPNEDALVPFMWLDYANEQAAPESGVAFYLFTAPTGMPLRVEDATGKEVWKAEGLDPYGSPAPNAPMCPTRLRFAGHFHDEDLDLFYNRFRDYDPCLGRYLQPDPLGHAGGTNLFAYSSNPLAFVDLRGLTHRTRQTPDSDDDGQNGKKKKSKEAERPEMLKKAEAEAKRRGLVRNESDAGPPFPKGTRKVEYGTPPNATYHVDSKGRILRAEGDLDPPTTYKKKGVDHVDPDGFVPNQDHRGHLIPERSAAEQQNANVRENVIAEHGTESNTSTKKAFENRARNHSEDNPGCRMISEPQYDGDNPRPTSVTHTVVDQNGKPVKDPKMLPNPQKIPNPTR